MVTPDAVNGSESVCYYEIIPEFYCNLIQSMLEFDPAKRPSAFQVFCGFSQSEPVAKPAAEQVFSAAGDL